MSTAFLAAGRRALSSGQAGRRAPVDGQAGRVGPRPSAAAPACLAGGGRPAFALPTGVPWPRGPAISGGLGRCLGPRPGGAARHASSSPAAGAPSSPPLAGPLPLGPAAAAGIAPDRYVVVNFYHLVDVADHAKAHAAHARALAGLDIAGRIYITPQGINAQFSGPAADADAYVAWVRGQAGFAGITPSAEPAPGGCHLFPRLRLKLKPDLISLAGGCTRLPLTDPAARAKPLKPDEWAAMLAVATGSGAAGGGEDASTSASAPAPATTTPIILDVRNGYEWDAGHFVGAARPLEDTFSETPTDVAPRPAAGAGPRADGGGRDDATSGEDSEAGEGGGGAAPLLPIPAHLAAAPRDAPIMMYCTGGIRCDVYSAHLAAQGFTNLYTLEGGVHRYFRERGGAGWDGSLFVFDARLAVAPDGRSGIDPATDGAAPLPSASPCALCGGAATLPHLNCANVDCNALFIACRPCAAARRGCCCEACMDAPRLLRPAKVSGRYGTWAEEAAAAAAAADGGGVASSQPAVGPFTRRPNPPPEAAAAMAAGRGTGRMTRRRARAARLAEKREAGRAERAQRKAAVRAAAAAAARLGAGEAGEAGERGDEGVAGRLAALRARLARPAPEAEAVRIASGGSRGEADASSSTLVAEFAAPCPACGLADGARTRIARFAGGGGASSRRADPLILAADACEACGWRGAVDAWGGGDGEAEAGEGPGAAVRLTIATPAAAAARLPPLPVGGRLSIPELDLDMPVGAAAAGAASPAGLLAAVRAGLSGPRVSGGGGGCEDAAASAAWSAFWATFEDMEAHRRPWTLVVSAGEE